MNLVKSFRATGFLFIALAVFTGCKQPASVERAISLHPVYVAARNSIFAIGSSEAGVQGTAFLVRHNGNRYLVASLHVVAKLDNLVVEDQHRIRYRGLKLLAVDRSQDLAVMDAVALPKQLPGLRLGKFFETSQAVVLMGYPDMSTREYNLNFANGVISDARYLGPKYVGVGETEYIQVTTPINLGHSGSPLLNERAEVIGVVAWRFAPTGEIQGGNYAVPFLYLGALLDRIGKGRAGGDSPPESGRKCQDDTECDWLDFCLSHTCQRLRKAGGSCSVDDDCLLPYRCFNSKCSQVGKEGEACQNDILCRKPFYCIQGKCSLLGRRGDGCSIDRDCNYPLFCIGAKCVKEVSGENGPCSYFHHCVAPMGCIEGKCVKTEGRKCTQDLDCSPLLCILGTCRALGKEGDRCKVDTDCTVPMKCQRGTCQTIAPQERRP